MNLTYTIQADTLLSRNQMKGSIMSLSEKTCIPCSGGTPTLNRKKVSEFLSKLSKGWEINTSGHLYRHCSFHNFREAVKFVNLVAKISEKEGHHPDLKIGWGYCLIEIWTHKINGLSESDFILASKIDNLDCMKS